jgi:DNA-binding Lrp family transcriptional regulator
MRDSVDETDLELINALQVMPRASWETLGRALTLDSATVARRWKRLHDAGFAWVTCGVGPPRHNAFCMAYVEIECVPGELDNVQNAFAEQPEVVYIHHVTGPRGLLVVVARRSPALISEYIRDAIEPMPGIRTYHAEIRTAGYVEASRWRLRSLDPSQQRALDSRADPEQALSSMRLDTVDQRIYQLLHEDGRMPFATLAERAGISEPTARRRVNRLLNHNILRLRCDMAQSISGWPVSAVLWANIPPQHLENAVRSLSAVPQVRLCCSLTGSRNLLLMVWLHTLDALPRLEKTLCERAQELTIVDRSICLHTVKQLGRLLDRDGRATANVLTTTEAFPVP